MTAVPVRFASPPLSAVEEAEEDVLVAVFDHMADLTAPTAAPRAAPSLGGPTRSPGSSHCLLTSLCHPPPAILTDQASDEHIAAVLRLEEQHPSGVHKVLVSCLEMRRRPKVLIALAGRCFDAPMRLELSAWGVRGVYEEVAFDGQQVITTPWVLP